jgi:adenylate cyclase
MCEARKIAAILVADVVGYCQLAAEDRTLARLRGLRSDLVDPAIDSHQGCILKRIADDGFIEFCAADAEHHPVWALNGSLRVLTGLQ